MNPFATKDDKFPANYRFPMKLQRVSVEGCDESFFAFLQITDGCNQQNFREAPARIEVEGKILDKRSFTWDGVMYGTDDPAWQSQRPIQDEVSLVTLAKMPNSTPSLLVKRTRMELDELEEAIGVLDEFTRVPPTGFADHTHMRAAKDRVRQELADAAMALFDIGVKSEIDIVPALRELLDKCATMEFDEVTPGIYERHGKTKKLSTWVTQCDPDDRPLGEATFGCGEDLLTFGEYLTWREAQRS